MGAYTSIDDPSAYFQTAIYTGNGGTQSITNDGNSNLQPDWIWTKSRTDSSFNAWTDSTRGTSKRIYSNSTSGEESHADRVTAFNSDGFSIGASSILNTNNYNYVAWQWKANGGTTATNTTGSLSTVVQANTTAGFSIVTWTGAGGVRTVGHGLGVAPDVIIVKNRSTSTQWGVWINSLADTDKNFRINSSGGEIDDNLWNDTLPASTVFSIGSAAEVSGNSIAYCFAEKQGFSKFGGYTGNGSADGRMIATGFRPAFVMTKKDGTGGWFIQDIKRGIRNSNSGTALEANTANAEADIGATGYDIDFLSNGFKHRQGNTYTNASGSKYIYMAFAEHPFVTSTGIPTTAR
tara:strand:- start:153 stop:1199 length:1047 start_codon:yes stop_codon:yes gene_type:complete